MMRQLLTVYLAAVNVMAFTVCAADKLAAKRGWRRVPERTLLALCALGGSAAFWLAMQLFRHKTRKPRFAWGVPLMLAAQLCLLWWLMPKF